MAPDSEKTMIGQVLGHFRVLERLGEGGMGVVYLAEDIKLKRKVALKMLPTKLAGDQGRLERFRREAEALAALKHPNIVTVYSIEESDLGPFLTMELVEGRSLKEVIPKGGFDLDSFFEIATPLADALSSAHDRGVVHRDLKPSNIMITDEGVVKILDFGLAKLRHDEVVETDPDATELDTATLTREGQVVGTLPYMSPEQVEGHAVDERTDIFSLGVVFYQMATGHRPFRGDSAAGLLSSILRDTPASVTEVNVDYPNHLGRIVRHCLEKDPGRRFQSARDVANELEALQQEVALETGELAARRPAGPIGKTKKMMVGLLVSIAVVAVLWKILRPPPPPPEPVAVAVLPFANLTGDADREVDCEGVSAGLFQKLSEVRDLRLVSRTEVASLKGQNLSATQLARELGVGLVVEGDVQQADGLLNVNVSLTDTGQGTVLWSEAFEQASENLLEMQKRIAEEVATAIALPLSEKERRRIAKNPTSSYQAYKLYLKGRFLMEDSSDPLNLDIAAALFRQAIEIDPEFALAHVGLSYALWRIYYRDLDAEVLAEAEDEAEWAAEIDPELPAAQIALALVYRSNGRYETSIAGIRGVLARHPRPDDAQRELAFSYEQVGELEEAESWYRAATLMGEDKWFNWNALGAFLVRTGSYEEATEVFEKAKNLAPQGVIFPQDNLAVLAILQGDFEGAIAAYELIPRPIRDADLASNIGTAYYFSNRPDKLERAEEYYRLAARLNPMRAEIQGNLADLLLRLDHREEALEHYRKALGIVEQQLSGSAKQARTAFAQWRPLLIQRATYAAKAEECGKAVPLAFELRQKIPETARDLHDLGYSFALCGETEAALEVLDKAIELGFAAELIAIEDEFESLRGLPEFEELVGRQTPAAASAEVG
jgi:TolB-like protein/Tfp pilus assembly protein PilF/predicted Ser/Thr protein kinase